MAKPSSKSSPPKASKRYVVKKYVMAVSASEALSKERSIQPDDVWLDEKQPEQKEGTSAIGFKIPTS